MITYSTVSVYYVFFYPGIYFLIRCRPALYCYFLKHKKSSARGLFQFLILQGGDLREPPDKVLRLLRECLFEGG
jgi:hypothetical protein